MTCCSPSLSQIRLEVYVQATLARFLWDHLKTSITAHN